VTPINRRWFADYRDDEQWQRREDQPALDSFLTVLEKLPRIGPAEVSSSDTPYDIEAAAKCGIASVAVRSGKFKDEQLPTAGAIAIYDDVAALLADYTTSPLGR
jgi:phosphoglycolate phosphatase-like HAD superfamily hydrolase